MNTLNTIIEEEIVRIRTDLKMYEVPYLEAFLTTAMQRAYEAGREERDTYWKERVGEITKDVCHYVEQMEETVDGEWGKCRDWQELYKSGTFPDFYDKVKALDTLLDNLK